MRRLFFLLILGSLTASFAHAQDQTLQFSGFRSDVSAGSADDKTICSLTDLTKAGTITDANVTALRTMATTAMNRIGVSFTGNDIAIIHLVKWGDLNVSNQVWFTVTASGGWLKQNTVDARLFGTSRPVLVFVYSGLSSGVDQVAYKITTKNKIPENLQNVIDLAKAVAAGTVGAFLEPTNSCAWGAQALPLNHVPSDVTIQAFAQKHAKTPPGASLTATFTGPVGAPFSTIQVQRTAASANATAVAVCKAGVCTANIQMNAVGQANFPASLCEHVACDVKEFDSSGKTLGTISVGPLDESANTNVAATKNPSSTADDASKSHPPQIGSKVFNNEDLTWWDVSLMMQVNSVSEIQYNATDGTVQPAKVTKQNLFAVADLFPLRHYERHWKIKGQFIAVPVAIAIPLNSTPLDRPFFGAGVGTRAFQFMVGASYDSVSNPKSLTVGSASTPSKLAADSTTHRVTKLMFGLNVSVTSVVNALTKNKTANTATPTPAPKPPAPAPAPAPTP